MPRSSNATASAFGWEFQSNAAIMLMLKNIEKASKVKVEGENEDVEITFSNGNMLMAQAKAVEDPDDFRNVKGKLEAGLRTLDAASKIANVEQLVFVTNSPNPFNNMRTMYKFSSPLNMVPFSELPSNCQKSITDICSKNGYSIDTSMLTVCVMRMLMYALGYPIPNTRGIRFSDYETVLTVMGTTGSEFILTRNGNYIEITHEGTESGYSLPAEQSEMHALIFGIENLEVVDNLLGAFYVDQEKGWTLLNRGKAIGNIHFSLESLLRGLSDKSNDELSQRLSVVRRELQKYRHMLDVAKYKAEINKLGETLYSDSPADEIDTALEVLYCERKPIEEELRRIKSVIRKNSSFEKYITSFRLRVKAPDGSEIPVNKDTLVGYADTTHLLVAKQKIVCEQLAVIDRRIHQLKAKQDKESMLFDVKSNLEQFDSEISKIDVDALATQRIIAKLKKEQKDLKEQVITSVKQNNPLVTELHDLISQYATRLGLDEKYVSARSDYIFTDDLKSLSGAIFHKVVFAFKTSYVALIRNHTGVCLPIILDSPSGREVSEENVNEMMAILAENYAEHQIIIASIYNNYDFSDKNIIELQDRLLPF